RPRRMNAMRIGGRLGEGSVADASPTTDRVFGSLPVVAVAGRAGPAVATDGNAPAASESAEEARESGVGAGAGAVSVPAARQPLINQAPTRSTARIIKYRCQRCPPIAYRLSTNRQPLPRPYTGITIHS